MSNFSNSKAETQEEWEAWHKAMRNNQQEAEKKLEESENKEKNIDWFKLIRY